MSRRSPVHAASGRPHGNASTVACAHPPHDIGISATDQGAGMPTSLPGGVGSRRACKHGCSDPRRSILRHQLLLALLLHQGLACQERGRAPAEALEPHDARREPGHGEARHRQDVEDRAAELGDGPRLLRFPGGLGDRALDQRTEQARAFLARALLARTVRGGLGGGRAHDCAVEAVHRVAVLLRLLGVGLLLVVDALVQGHGFARRLLAEAGLRLGRHAAVEGLLQLAEVHGLAARHPDAHDGVPLLLPGLAGAGDVARRPGLLPKAIEGILAELGRHVCAAVGRQLHVAVARGADLAEHALATAGDGGEEVVC
mmetsp:Transcript_136539/g.424202  ORF Transcript_136539/g.424202 Transcript_136539/m.424202 type:complete len:315 (+) Transcript_136539:147-1091(+)